jgi:hypothetical protein
LIVLFSTIRVYDSPAFSIAWAIPANLKIAFSQGHEGHARIAIAATNRNSFSVVPLAA